MRRVWLALIVTAAAVAGGLAVQGGRTETQYRRLLEEGEAALAEGRSYAAIEKFSGALAFRPDSMVAHLRRGEAYQQQESFDAAIRDLTTAARLDPNAPQPLERLGEVYAERGDFARAAEWYSQAASRDVRSASALLISSRTRDRSGSRLVSLLSLCRSASRAAASRRSDCCNRILA